MLTNDERSNKLRSLYVLIGDLLEDDRECRFRRQFSIVSDIPYVRENYQLKQERTILETRVNKLRRENELLQQQLAAYKLVQGTAQKEVATEKNTKEKSQTKGQNFGFTAKELKEMPYLKDLHYRKINGVHQFRYRRDGYSKSFNSKNLETAKAKAYEFIYELKKIMRVNATHLRAHTLDTVANAWLELKKPHVNKSTFRVYYGIYHNHIAPKFGNRAVKNLLPMDLQPFFNDLYARQEKTCEDAKIVLNGILKYAVANRMCPTNPMDGVIVEKHFRKTGSALTDAQLERFKTAIRGAYIELACLIILYSGIRGFELESVLFDWVAGTMTVQNAKLKKSQKNKPENLYRIIPIFPGLWALRERIESGEPWRYKSSTLSSKLGNYWTESTIKDLRHTFSTKLRQSGVENELVNIWMGHSPGKNLTANTYTHFEMDFQKNEAKKIKPY